MCNSATDSIINSFCYVVCAAVITTQARPAATRWCT